MAIKKKRILMSILSLLLLSQVQAQERTLTKYEYWIDNIETLFTTGTLNGQSEQTLQLAIDPKGCNEGLHYFYCRFQDSEGRWSSPLSWPFIVRALPQNEEVKVVKAEYWIDSNEKIELTVDANQLAFTVDAAGVGVGLHTLNYRLLNNEGRYSPLYTWMFLREELLDESVENTVSTVEYWIDDLSNGIHEENVTGNEINLSIDASSLHDGLHKLVYRFKDVRGRYSTPTTWAFVKNKPAPNAKVSWYKYWWDDHEDLAVTESVESSGREFVFEKQLTVPEYIMAAAKDNEPLTSTFHIIFGDDAGRVSGISSTDVSYVKRAFQIEPNDLLELKNLYNQFGGSQWTTAWTFLDQGMQAADLPGVSFMGPDELGYWRVSELHLSAYGLKGDVSQSKLYFPRLTYLDLSNNRLTGDLTPFVEELKQLKTLDVRNNMLTGLRSLPTSVATLYQGGQMTQDAASILDELTPVVCYIRDRQPLDLPTILTYQLAANEPVPSAVDVISRGATVSENPELVLEPLGQDDFLYTTLWKQHPYTYLYSQDWKVCLRTVDGSLYPAVLRYVHGDADMSGYTDLLDVQSTITEILNPALLSLFNQSAADTYADKNINVQDVVCTVNIVLDQEDMSDETVSQELPSSQLSFSRRLAPAAYNQNTLYVEDERLWLDSRGGIASIEVCLKGVRADEVSLLLKRSDFQLASRNTADGSRHIIYSLSGATIPSGATALLRLSHSQVNPLSAMLSTLAAQEAAVRIVSSDPTAVNGIEHKVGVQVLLDHQQLTLHSAETMEDVCVTLTNAGGVQVYDLRLPRIEKGISTFPINLPSGVYLVNVFAHGEQIYHVKLVK